MAPPYTPLAKAEGVNTPHTPSKSIPVVNPLIHIDQKQKIQLEIAGKFESVNRD